MCGIPGSGKTTLANQLASEHSAKLISFDNLPNAHNPKYAEDVRKQMWSDISENLRNGRSVVCDDVNTKLKWRQGIFSAIADISCKKVLVTMNTPLEECLYRNSKRKFRLPDFVIIHTHKNQEPPILNEGWDEILYY